MYRQRRTLRCGGRPKAFWGAIIGAATSIAGSLLGNAAEKKKQRLANSKEDYNQSLQEGQSMSNALNQSLDYQNNYYDQYRVAARYGRRSLADNGHKIVITDGGDAKRIGHDTFLLRGGSHEDVNETGQTGIGINVGGNEIEAEGGEVAQKKGNSLRIFSAQPILNGISPAQAVIQGADKNKVFEAQQKYKKNNHLKDDGTKAQWGTKTNAPTKAKHVIVNPNGSLQFNSGFTPNNGQAGTLGLSDPLFQVLTAGRSTSLNNLIRVTKALNKIRNNRINISKEYKTKSDVYKEYGKFLFGLVNPLFKYGGRTKFVDGGVTYKTESGQPLNVVNGSLQDSDGNNYTQLLPEVTVTGKDLSPYKWTREHQPAVAFRNFMKHLTEKEDSYLNATTPYDYSKDFNGGHRQNLVNVANGFNFRDRLEQLGMTKDEQYNAYHYKNPKYNPTSELAEEAFELADFVGAADERNRKYLKWCAENSNLVNRQLGRPTQGDAWTRFGVYGTKNILVNPNVNKKNYTRFFGRWTVNRDNADYVEKNIDKVDLKTGDIVDLSHAGSSMRDRAFDKGDYNRANSHTGTIYKTGPRKQDTYVLHLGEDGMVMEPIGKLIGKGIFKKDYITGIRRAARKDGSFKNGGEINMTKRRYSLGGRPKAEDGTLKYYNGVQETDAIPTRLFNERRRLTYTNSDYTAGPSDISDQIMDYINSKTDMSNQGMEVSGFRGRGGSKGGRRFKGTSGRNPKSAPSLGDLMTGRTKLTGKGKTASLTTATPTNIKPKPMSNPLPTENINAYPFYKMLGEVSRFRGLPGKVQQPRVPRGIASSKEAGDAAMKAAEASNDVLQSLQKVYRLRHPFARSTPKETYNPNRFNREYRAARNNGMTREEFTRSQSANKRKAGKYTSLALAMPAAAVIATKVIGKDDVNGGSKDNINTQLSPYIARPVEQLNKGNKPVQKKQVTKAKGNTLPEVVVTAKKPTTIQYKGNVTKGNYQLHDGESKTINGIKYTRSGNTIINHKTNVGYVYDKNGNYTGQADYSKVGKNFNEAFDAAKKAGRNDFIYHAGKYNKYSTNKEEDAKKEALNRRIGARRIAKRLGGYSRPVERLRCGGSARPKASKGGIFDSYGNIDWTSAAALKNDSGGMIPWQENNYYGSVKIPYPITDKDTPTKWSLSNSSSSTNTNNNVNNGGYKNTTFTTGDYIGLGIDTAAALATGIINYRGAGNYSLPERSGFIQAGKLKTNYNVNPQVAELERARDRMAQDVYRNSSSSVAALNRANILNVNAAEDINKLLAEKENKETELINQDILNRQSVSEKNIANQMAYNNSVAEIKNAANQSRINAINGSLSGLSQAWTNFYTAGRSAFEDNQARIAAIAASEKGSLSRMLLSGYRLDDNTLANLYRNEENKDTKQLILNSMSPRARRRLGII